MMTLQDTAILKYSCCKTKINHLWDDLADVSADVDFVNIRRHLVTAVASTPSVMDLDQ